MNTFDVKQVYLICAGGHAKQVVDVFMDNGYEILGAFDDHKTGHFYRGVNIIGTLNDIEKYDGPFFCTIGDNTTRQKICNRKNLKWTNCISRLAYISSSVKMGIGNYIGVHVRILSDSQLGNFNIVNDGATLTHDNIVGDFNHIAPSASLGGKVKIGNLNLIGTNVSVNPDVIISDNIIIGSGAVVNKSINVSGTYVGVPVRKL